MNDLKRRRYVCLLQLAILAVWSAQAAPDKVDNNGIIQTEIEQPPDAAEISLGEFFKLPVGPRGLEPTKRLLSLRNERVHVTGYMAKEQEPLPGLFMLASVPVVLSEKEDGPADSLPPATLFVHMPAEDANRIISFRPGLWELTGVLEIGNKEEVNGRVSYTRLILE